MTLRSLSSISALICLASLGAGVRQSAAFPALPPNADGLSSLLRVDCPPDKARHCKFNAQNNLCGWGDKKCVEDETAKCIERCAIQR
jgi:hypothetical protein